MFEINDEATGTSDGLRSWAGRGVGADERAVIIAESHVPGACVSDVARRWRPRPQQLYQWRHAALVDAA